MTEHPNRAIAAVAGSKVARGRADPLIYQRVIERLNVKAAHCVVLEDERRHARNRIFIRPPRSRRI